MCKLNFFTAVNFTIVKFVPIFAQIYQKFSAVNCKNNLLFTNLLTSGVNLKFFTSVNSTMVTFLPIFTQIHQKFSVVNCKNNLLFTNLLTSGENFKILKFLLQ